MNVKQILEIFYSWPIFELVAFFLVHTLAAYLVVIPIRSSNKCFSQNKCEHFKLYKVLLIIYCISLHTIFKSIQYLGKGLLEIVKRQHFLIDSIGDCDKKTKSEKKLKLKTLNLNEFN